MNIENHSSFLSSSKQSRWQTAVNVIAYFIITSSIINLVLSILGIILDHRNYAFTLLDFCNILGGNGLLKYKRGWRIYLLAYIWFAIVIGIPVISMDILGEKIGDYRVIQNNILFAERICYVGCLVILYHPQVRKLFRNPAKNRSETDIRQTGH